MQEFDLEDYKWDNVKDLEARKAKKVTAHFPMSKIREFIYKKLILKTLGPTDAKSVIADLKKLLQEISAQDSRAMNYIVETPPYLSKKEQIEANESLYHSGLLKIRELEKSLQEKRREIEEYSRRIRMIRFEMGIDTEDQVSEIYDGEMDIALKTLEKLELVDRVLQTSSEEPRVEDLFALISIERDDGFDPKLFSDYQVSDY